MFSFIHISPLLRRWGAILLPSGLIINGWIIEALFARIMANLTGVLVIWGIQNSTFEWWKLGDLVAQWVLYGCVAWLLVKQSYCGHEKSLPVENEAGVSVALKDISLKDTHFSWALALVLLYADITFRYSLEAPWFYGTQMEERLIAQWLPRDAFTTGEYDPLLDWKWARGAWMTRPLWPFLTCTLLSLRWYWLQHMIAAHLKRRQNTASQIS